MTTFLNFIFILLGKKRRLGSAACNRYCNGRARKKTSLKISWLGENKQNGPAPEFRGGPTGAASLDRSQLI
ncbi:hypothetical protein [Azospira sp.]|uniref:hypothetical protein n=1 Tax=Azospira sp. TaxID=1872671 RepID=UPI00255F13BE|nr:hypothetical protein [Azospira sp.]MDK9692199.1 hypothetical protein [Azospira sp.]